MEAQKIDSLLSLKNDGHRRFIPLNPHTKIPKFSGYSDPTSWQTYSQLEAQGEDTVGYMFTDGPICGVDLDNVLDDRGRPNKLAQWVLNLTDTAVEYSASRNGLHVYFQGQITSEAIKHKKSYPGIKANNRQRDTSNLEFYNGHYFRMTWDIYEGRDVIMLDDAAKQKLFVATAFHIPFWSKPKLETLWDMENLEASFMNDEGEIDHSRAFYTLLCELLKCGVNTEHKLQQCVLQSPWATNYEKFDRELGLNGQQSTNILTKVVSGAAVRFSGKFQNLPSDKEMAEAFLQSTIGEDYRYLSDRWFKYADGFWLDVGEIEVGAALNKFIEDVVIPAAYPKKWLPYVKGVLAMAQFYEPAKLPQEPTNHLVLKNGTLNLTSGELLPHSRELFMLAGAGYSYAPTEQNAEFDAYIQSCYANLGDEVMNFLGRFFYMTLSRDYTRAKNIACLTLVGRPGSGKTTLIDVLLTALTSSNYLSFNLKDVTDRFALGGLVGKRLISVAEANENTTLRWGDIYPLWNRQEIHIERKFEQPFPYTPQAVMIMTVNKMPKLPDIHSGGYRRLVVVELDEIPPEKRNGDYEQMIKSSPAACLNWILSFKGAYLSEGLNVPASIADNVEQLKRDNDYFVGFLDEILLPGEAGDRLTLHECYAHYQAWAKRDGLTRPMAKQTFEKELRTRDVKITKIGRQKFVSGRRLPTWDADGYKCRLDAFDGLLMEVKPNVVKTVNERDLESFTVNKGE